jgi:hypothetical protein
MKNQFLLILVTLFAVAIMSANAQDNKGPEKIGFRAGFQNSSFHKDGSKVSGTKDYNSFYVGLFRDNKLMPTLHLGTGLEYLQNGAKMSNDAKLLIHYLSVPVYLKAKIGPVFALGGMAANFKLSEKYSVGGNSNTLTDEQKPRSIDFPVFAGAGMKILMFSIEARYHWGLTESKDGVKNQYLQIGAAIAF